jgi:uncharacterized protein (DUF2336 family)
MLAGLVKRLFGGRDLTYAEARDKAAALRPDVRIDLAARTDLPPEILYYLAEDPAPEVRRRVAANAATPAKANALLATDVNDLVRQDLAGKIARLLPELSAPDQDKLRRLATETLEVLARDQIAMVRQILAEALKDVAQAPPEVIVRLARDAEIAVAAPILQFSPVLSDDDLLEIIASSPIAGALSAIARRHVVTFAVTDAIADSNDVDAIAVLLGNTSAQIRETTLDRLIDRAPDIDAWHEPLVLRPHLTARMAHKLARFAAAHLLQLLSERRDLAPEAAQAVAGIVKKRLDDIAHNGPAAAEARKVITDDAAMDRALRLQAAGNLDETTVDTALSGGDNAFVVAALAVLSTLPVTLIRKVVATQSAKGCVSVAWKAGLSVELAEHLQAKLLHLPYHRILKPAPGGSYPLAPDAMTWHLEVLGDD